jgi:protein-S-isoprenylcysteine O-methyltransferase Ste14
MLALVMGAAGYRIAVEEGWLYSKYGEAHRAYRRRTKMIIPYIW